MYKNKNGLFVFKIYRPVWKVTFCTTTIVRKKKRGNDVTSCYDVTSGHATSGDVISGDVTSGNTPFPNYAGLQVLKTVKY